MARTRKRRGARRPVRKKPYRPPRLVVHGDLRKLTRVKAGTKADGAAKPATRATGANA